MEELFTDTSFYYFYSTVPQVLAGGIALVGAFLIFFIAESNRNMTKLLKDTWKYINDRTAIRMKLSECIGEEKMHNLEFIENLDRKYYSEYFEEINECLKNEGHDVITGNYKQFIIVSDLKSNVIKKGICAVKLSGILMAACIFVLPFVQGLIKCLPIGILIIITVLIIGFSCYAIYLITNVVASTIRKL